MLVLLIVKQAKVNIGLTNLSSFRIFSQKKVVSQPLSSSSSSSALQPSFKFTLITTTPLPTGNAYLSLSRSQLTFGRERAYAEFPQSVVMVFQHLSHKMTKLSSQIII